MALGLKLKSGRMRARLEVDRSTWLPTTLRSELASCSQTEWRFADYRSDLGFKFPGKTTETADEVTDTFVVQSIGAMEGELQGVTARPHDVRFSAGVSPEVAIRRAPTGHMLVRPKVDDVDLGWFVLDSGAGQSAITPAAAERLRLDRIGTVLTSSVFGTAPTVVRRGKSLELGPVRIDGVHFIEMDLGFLTQPLGVEVSGIVGYDLLSRCVAEIDLAVPALKLFDPERYRGEGLPWRDLVLHKKVPVVRARFEGGREEIFRLDLGAGGAAGNVLFHTPAVREMGLTAGRPNTRTLDAAGQAYVAGRIDWFELWGHRFENPQVLFALADQGPLADPYLAGNIGTRFLEVFKVVLDYPHKRVALQERAPAGS